jgi:predicted RNase H-like HicB family nuclease
MRSISSINLSPSMQYQVLVQNPSQSRFVASIVGMAGVVAEGETEAEAVASVKAALESQLATAKLVTIEVTQPSHFTPDPWLKHFGVFADDPTFDDFLEEVAAYRQHRDHEAEA